MDLGGMIPDPPDEPTEDVTASNPSTGKDSQESITLRNALQSLPDTQTDTPSATPLRTNRSPEHRDTPSVQLYSRPKEQAATDLDVGFSWGQPMKIDPGRFSNRPKPSQASLPPVDSSSNEAPSTILTGPGPRLDEQTVFEDDDVIPTAEPGIPTSIPVPQETHLSPRHCSRPLAQAAPSVAQDHVSARAYQHQAVIGVTPVSSEAAAVRVARKKPPFDDFQPARRVAHQQGQMSKPTTTSVMPSQGRLMESRCDEHCADTTQGRSEPNTLQQPLDQGYMKVPPQKARTSLRNDISVSSDRAPRQLPQHISTSLGTANRPARADQGRSPKLNTPRTRSRATPATGSNTKRKCTARDSIASSESRCSSRYPSAQQQETPSLRPRQHSPQDQLREMFIQKLAVHKGEVAGYLNEKWSDMEQQMDQQIHGVIDDLKQKLKQQEIETSLYKKHTRSKDSKIQKLEEDHERLVGMLQASERELQERRAKFSKLDDKCRKYKEYLNSAISEQQELYKATKAKCDGAIAQMQAEESKRQLSQEHERKKAESARERLNQLVKTTVAEHKQRERELNDKIGCLSQKIQERDADLLRERENTQILQQQNVSINSIQDTLKRFETQIEDVVSKAIEAASCQNKHDPNSGDLHIKLDQIMRHLQSLDERVYSKDNVSKELQELNENAVVSILGKLEPILDSQLETKANLDHLCSGFEEYVDQLWAALENRQIVLEERIEQRQAENEQQINFLQNELEMSQQECDKQKQLAGKLEAAVSERQSEIDGLLNEVAELEGAQVDSLAQSERLKRVQEEHAQLKEEATAKAAKVSKLEAKLQESKVALAMEGQKHQKDADELRKLLEKRLAQAQADQVLAVEAAQRNAMLQMNGVKAEIEKRLGQVLEERETLQKDLEAAKQRIVAMGDDGSSSSEKIQLLEQELETSRLEAAKFKEEVGQKDKEQQNTKEQQSTLVADLQSQLANADRKYSTLVENAKSYDRAAHSVWQSLKQWTSDYAAIQEVRAELHKTKDADIDQIDPKFQPLVQIQLLQKAVARYCRTQKAAAEMLSGENLTCSESASFNAEGQSMSRSSPPATESQETESQSSLGGILSQLRRVVVKSPASNAPSPMPPSIQNEQKRRRTAYPPKPILKLALGVQAQEAEDEALPQGLLDRLHSTDNALSDMYQHGKSVDSASSHLNRSPYNRLVAGSQASRVLPVVEKGLFRNNQSSDGMETTTEKGSKRKEFLKQEPEAPRKRARPTMKGQRTFLSTPHSPPPEPGPNDAAGVKHVPRAPRKTGHRALADEPLTSPVRSSQLSRDNHQHQAAPSTGTRRPSLVGRMLSSKRTSSLKTNKDPLSPFFLPLCSARGNEGSQGSFTLSQDVDVEARSQASLLSFKKHVTMGR